ncbi:MAG: hypothetical protein DMG40_24705 [Acidobacteria bacterium]|nr:MAG: hypothetical protein DMG40_24705 [Acidobacteriota bacterium]
MDLWQPGNEPPGDYMMLSLYFTLGIFLLLAVRNPSAHRSLIPHAGRANIARAAVMVLMAIHPASDRKGLLIGVALAGPIGIALIALAPAKQSAAEGRGERYPKVLLKLGHWHVRRGSGPSHLQTLGNFVTEFATANGTQALTVGVYLRGPWRDVATQDGLKPIALASDTASWSVIDFRPVRAVVAGGHLGTIQPNLLSHLYGFDAGLVIGGASPATYTVLEQGARKQ